MEKVIEILSVDFSFKMMSPKIVPRLLHVIFFKNSIHLSAFIFLHSISLSLFPYLVLNIWKWQSICIAIAQKFLPIETFIIQTFLPSLLFDKQLKIPKFKNTIIQNIRKKRILLQLDLQKKEKENQIKRYDFKLGKIKNEKGSIGKKRKRKFSALPLEFKGAFHVFDSKIRIFQSRTKDSLGKVGAKVKVEFWATSVERLSGRGRRREFNLEFCANEKERERARETKSIGIVAHGNTILYGVGRG